MTDQNRKTLRSFYCRDYLWEHFEQMAQELGCSMDYLINESMRLYARDRDQSAGPQPPSAAGGSGAAAGQSRQAPAASTPAGSRGRQSQPQGVAAGASNPGSPSQAAGGADPAENHRTFQQVPSVGNSNRSQSSPGPSGAPGGPPPPPPRPGGNNASGGGQSASGNWQQQNQSGPPHPPGGDFGNQGGLNAGRPAGQSPLYLAFNNNRYVIDQQKYVIGRGSKHTDLTIRDGNISRKHCAIIYRNGSYYIKDLDSTNGVEYRGNRIESKKIEEGDVFYLCDYELRFSFRG